ncbi:SMEK domain-containing protein [Bacillus cereus]
MRRDNYYSYISEKIELLCLRIKSSGQLNVLNLNIHAEFFYRDLCRILFEWNLENENDVEPNAAAIDLIDKDKKIIIQVSSSATKKKVNETFSKKKLLAYKEQGYTLKFLFLTEVTRNFRNLKFNNKYNINFNPTEDIMDKKTIIGKVLASKIDKQKDAYELVKAELGEQPDITKITSNLADLVNLLSETNLSSVSQVTNLNDYNIDCKIKMNGLKDIKPMIGQYKIYYTKLNKIYKEFDNQGKNKSLSVFSKLTRFYTEEVMNQDSNQNQKFINIINNTRTHIQQSDNYNELPFETLEMCVSIIVVDAFIRCKIFENPEGYNHVTA